MWVLPVAATAAFLAGVGAAAAKYVLPAVTVRSIPLSMPTDTTTPSPPLTKVSSPVGMWTTYAPPTTHGSHSRGIPLAVFYPTTATRPATAATTTHWLPHGNDIRYANGLASYAGLPQIIFRRMRSHTIDALSSPSSSSALPHPMDLEALAQDRVVVFSHGLGGHRTMYSSLCMSLAAAGYIVVSMEHCDGSACFALPTVPHKEPSSMTAHVAIHCKKPPVFDLPPASDHKETHTTLQAASDLAFRERQLHQRLVDVDNVADAIRSKELLDPLFGESQEKAAAKYAKSVSLQLVGHSFGGATVLGAAAQAVEGCAQGGLPTVGGMHLSGVTTLDVWLWPCLSMVRRVFLSNKDESHITGGLPFNLQFIESEQWEKWTENRTVELELIDKINVASPSRASRHYTPRTDHMSASDMALFLTIPGIGCKKFTDCKRASAVIGEWAGLVAAQK